MTRENDATVWWTGNGRKNFYTGNNIENGVYEILISPKSVRELVKAGIIKKIGKLLYEPTDLDLWLFFEGNAKRIEKMGTWSVTQSQQNTILYFHDEWNKIRPQPEPTTHEEIKEHVRKVFNQENLEFLIRVGKKLEQGGTVQ